MTMRGLVVCVLLLVATPVAWGQSTLADETYVAATSDGVFVVVAQVTRHVLSPAAFGGDLLSPSITWIEGSDAFIVTTLEDGAGNPGGVWRMQLTAGGTATLVDLTASLPPGITARFSDASYSPALDLLFLLQHEQGQVLSWAKPATASLATLTPWGTVPPGAGRSIAVRGAEQPFAVVVALSTGPVLEVDKLGTHEYLASGGWDDIACQPVSGDLIVGKQNGSLLGMLATSSLMVDFNVSGLCGPIVAQPADVEWDGAAGRAVGIAGEALAACALGGVTTGENHIVRLPLTPIGGPANNQPVLLTPEGDSGISGTRADLALVRHDASAVTYWGFPGAGGGTSQPTFGHTNSLVLAKSAQLKLTNAPPLASALLVVGLHPKPTVFQGHFIMPAPQMLLPITTKANGSAQFTVKMPWNATSLLGLEFYMQWVVDDTTTPAGGDIASSQSAIFTVGVK